MVETALRVRGVSQPAATLAAKTGATIFGIAFSPWIRDDETRSLAAIVSDALEKLLNLTGVAMLSLNAACRPRRHRDTKSAL